MTAHFVNLLSDVQRASLRMASAVEDMVQESCEAFLSADGELARRVIRRDEEVDEEEVGIEAEVIRLMALFQPMGSDMRLLCAILKINNDLERVADCAVNIAERAVHLDERFLRSSAAAGVKEMCPLVQRLLRNALSAYASSDEQAARRILSDDQAVDALYEQFIREQVVEAVHSPEVMASHLDILSIAKNLERIADHATNIAEDVVFRCTGEIVRHRNS